MFVGHIKLEMSALVCLLAFSVPALGQSDLEIILSEFEMSFLGSGGTISDSTSAPVGGNLDIAESDRLLNADYTENGGGGDLMPGFAADDLRLWGDMLVEGVGGLLAVGVSNDLTPAFESMIGTFGFDLFTDDLNIVGDEGAPLLRLQFTAGELLLQDMSVVMTARAMVLEENLPLALTFGGVGANVLFEYTGLLPGFQGQTSTDSFASPQGEIRISAIPEPTSLAMLIASLAITCLGTKRNRKLL